MRNGLWQMGADQLATLLQTLRTWPWFDTARTLRQRFREDRLGITASSLTFTTLIALVPLLTVMLALFSAFPMFAKFQGALQQYFLQSLVPDGIAKPVLGTLTQFAAKANRLGSAGLVFLLFSALALMLTIDRTLNGIWRVRKPRPIAQRVLVYWAAITLGPLLLGMSLTPQLLCADGLARHRRRAARRRWRWRCRRWSSCCCGWRCRRCSATCPTPTCAGATRWPAGCSWPWASRWPSARWPGTWARCLASR